MNIVFWVEVFLSLLLVAYLFGINVPQMGKRLIALDILIISPAIMLYGISQKVIPYTWMLFPGLVWLIVLYLESRNANGSKLASNIVRWTVAIIKVVAFIMILISLNS